MRSLPSARTALTVSLLALVFVIGWVGWGAVGLADAMGADDLDLLAGGALFVVPRWLLFVVATLVCYPAWRWLGRRPWRPWARIGALIVGVGALFVGTFRILG